MPNLKSVKKIRAFNEWFAIQATDKFGTMGMFWLFVVWSFAPYIPLLTGAREAILYVSSGVIQLIALPLLMVGQNLVGRAAEVRAQADHEMICQELAAIKALHKTNSTLMQDMNALISDEDNLSQRLDEQDRLLQEILKRLQ